MYQAFEVGNTSVFEARWKNSFKDIKTKWISEDSEEPSGEQGSEK